MADVSKQALFRKLGPCCHYCRCEFPITRLTVDHIIPLVFGGPRYFMWNAVLACNRCNEAKGMKVGLCECERCTEAMRRWLRLYHPDAATTVRRTRGRLRRRSVNEVIAKCVNRIEKIQHRLDTVEVPPDEALAMRNVIHGVQFVLDLLRTIEEEEEDGGLSDEVLGDADAGLRAS